jgi:hypothetical protein
MTMRVFNLHDPYNTFKTLKLSLQARYWNKVTTFKDFGPQKNPFSQKSKAQLIQLKSDSFEFEFINSFFNE